jgi:hypothetical protein
MPLRFVGVSAGSLTLSGTEPPRTEKGPQGTYKLTNHMTKNTHSRKFTHDGNTDDAAGPTGEKREQ